MPSAQPFQGSSLCLAHAGPAWHALSAFTAESMQVNVQSVPSGRHVALRIRGPSLEGIEPSITRVCTLKNIVFEGADP